MKKHFCEARDGLRRTLTFEEVIMDSLDWELTQLCRKMERKQGRAREEEQKFQALSPEEQLPRGVRELDKGYRGNKRELERMNTIPLERLNEQELNKAVSMTLKMAVLDIVGTEGTRGLLRIRKYCGDELILESLVEALEQIFAYDKLDDEGKEKRRREEDLD
jgi:hypothetical protein